MIYERPTKEVAEASFWQQDYDLCARLERIERLLLSLLEALEQWEEDRKIGP